MSSTLRITNFALGQQTCLVALRELRSEQVRLLRRNSHRAGLRALPTVLGVPVLWCRPVEEEEQGRCSQTLIQDGPGAQGAPCLLQISRSTN